MNSIQIHIAILCVHPPGDRNMGGTVDPQDEGQFHIDYGPACTPDSGLWLLHLDADEDEDNYFKGASPTHWVGDFRHR
ncbi:MAG: hypothetical protein JSV78_14710 [Phycisphaerales bacterium]|nr:MAG: hypothetical protein JSV78_14710 [Phycisphaerales bacterium]